VKKIIAEKMRVIVALFACIIAVSMAVPDFTEDVEPQMQDMELLEVQNEAQATIAAMKKKGVTHADCKDLAKTSCEEVEREVSTDQSLLNKLKSGHHCMKLGVHSEKKALTHWNKEKRYHMSMVAKVTEARNTKVSISSQTYGTLRRGKCGWIFGSRSYLRVRASYNHAVKVEILARGRVREAEKSYTRMVEMRKREQYECHCTTKKAATKMWKVVTNKKRKVRQDKAYAKCKMMTCVLDGTKLTHRSCKGKLKTLKNKRLYSVTTRTNCSGHKTPSDKVAPADPCKKWQAEKKANAEVAKALKAQVSFGGGSTVIKAQGKRTLDKAAAVLRKYPWMTITVTGHSDAPKGRRCTQLVIGRAAATEKYLKSKGCKNKMTRPVGKCGKKRAIEIIANAAGQRSPPKGCGNSKKKSCVSEWKCLPGISTPVRLDVNTGNVSCMSSQGKHCWWGKCRGSKVPHHSHSIGRTSLICGAHHKKKWGGTGYGHKHHWCNKAKKGLGFTGKPCRKKAA